MKFNIDELRKHEKDGWIYSQVHETLPLIIWNYTNSTQYESHWNDITLNCRAMVTDQDGLVISKGFTKFFNYSEGNTNIPENIEYIKVFEKMDGSYIGLFYYQGQWIVNSKGSFNSDQSTWANCIFENLDFNKLNKNWTYCFELIVPENRIVCDYGDENSLYFLSAFIKGVEIDELYPYGLINTIIKFPSLMQLNIFEPSALQSKNVKNKEGYVVKFENGERCKIKFEEYIKLHSLYTRTSSYDIYNCLISGDDFKSVIDNAPDEIFNWIDEVKDEIVRDFNNLLTCIKSEYKTINLSLGHCSNKHFALFVKGNIYESYLFRLRYNKDIEQQIWKEVKPQYKTFGR
jgi:RNA ligase